MDGIESARRNRPVEETLALWREMVAGSPEGRRHCMRFRIDMQDPNKAMRDPVAYRCNDAHHWRTGTKYKARMSSLMHQSHSHHSSVLVCLKSVMVSSFMVFPWDALQASCARSCS